MKIKTSIIKLKEIIIKWIKSVAGIISTYLVAFSGMLIILVLFIPRDWDILKNIIIGLATNLLGIIVTVSFVQYFIDRQSAKEEKLEEYKKIIRYSKYSRILINEYIVYYNSVVTPLNRRDKIPFDRFKDEYSLHDMCDLYKSSILLRDRFYTPVIERYYEVEQELSCYFLRMIEEIDFKYTDDLETMMTNYLTTSRNLDVRRSIIGQQELEVGGKKNSECIAEELKHPKRDYLKDYAEGKLHAHMMTPVVQLYHFMLFQRDSIEEYLRIINRIENDILTSK